MEMKYENRIQLYSTANLKYPLDDFSEEDFPFNVLVDAAFSVPKTLMNNMRLTTYIRKTTYAFVCIEAGTTPIGHLYVVNPEPYRIYPLTMRCKGTAWIVLGPASSQEIELTDLDIPFDPACILANPVPPNQFKIRVNGVEHPMPNIITVRTNNFITAGGEYRGALQPPIPSNEPIKALTLRRNDNNLDEQVVRTSLTDIDTDHMPLTNINGVTPDADGDVTIKFTTEDAGNSSESSEDQLEAVLVPVVERTANKNIGFVIQTNAMEECVDPYIRLNAKIKTGKKGHGLPYDLPLDDYFDESSSSSSS